MHRQQPCNRHIQPEIKQLQGKHAAEQRHDKPKAAHRREGVAKWARPTSTVLPFARSSSFVSITYAMYHVSRLLSRASFWYFSIVRSSTPPMRHKIWPPSVDLPASTWPMKTTFMWLRLSSFASAS